MTRHRSAFSFVALSFIALLIQFSSSESKNLWGKVTAEEWALTAPAEYPDAQVIVLMDVCTLRVEGEGIRTERYTRLKLFKKEGVEKLNEFGILRDEDDKTMEFKAQTLLPDGRIIKADKKSIFHRSGRDWEVLSVAFPAVEPGCIVELKYVGSHRRFTYLEPWYFQSELYTQLSRLTIVLDPGFEYSTLFTNVPASFRTPAGDVLANLDDPEYPLRLFSWERKDMPPVDFNEPYIGFKDDFCATLICQLRGYDFGAVKVDFSTSWEKLGKEYFKNWIDNYLVGGDIDKLVKGIVVPGEDNIQMMSRIYQFVCDSTTLVERKANKYCNHSTVGEFVKERRGTEFDINFFFMALLKEANIKSQLVMVPSRRENRLIVGAPMSWQFSSSLVLAELDSSYAILDPANKFCMAGKVSPEFFGQQGLAVAEKGSTIIEIGDAVDRSYRLDATDMTIDANGKASCSTSVAMTGYFPAYYGRDEVARNDSTWVYYFICDRVDDTVKASALDFEYQSDGKLTCWARYDTERYARVLENNLFVKPIVLRFTENPFSAVRRSFPIDFKFPGTWHNIVTIRLAREPLDVTMPPDLVVEKDGATFKRMCRRNGAMIIIDSKLVITQPLYDAKSYGMIKELFDQIATAATDEVGASF